MGVDRRGPDALYLALTAGASCAGLDEEQRAQRTPQPQA
jgi:hypothetical protein